MLFIYYVFHKWDKKINRRCKHGAVHISTRVKSKHHTLYSCCSNIKKKMLYLYICNRI